MSAPTLVHIVFIAFSVSGHLNVHLASIEYLLSLSEEQSPPLHVHLLSFEPAAKHGRKLSALANTRHKFTFHSLGEPVLSAETILNGWHMDRHGPARLLTRGGLQSYRSLGEALGFNPEQYIALYEDILGILGTIKPKIDVAVVDILMPMGKDACVMANIHWGILCPNSGWALSKHSQPLLEGFCKFPAYDIAFSLFSDVQYPVPFHLIPYNIGLNIALLHTFLTNPKLKALEQRRSKAGIPGRSLGMPSKELPFMICASVKEIEYPHIYEKNVVYPGPILIPVPPLSSEQYPELAKFLDRKRTIVINMGSLFWYTHSDVENIAEAIVRAQHELPEKMTFQVLWKLNGKEKYEELLRTKFGDILEDVRTEEWLEPPALAILQHPNVAGFVNHGGANSVHEAAYAGVPQIILPQWLDLYDYAVRVEWLGHGIYANKNHAPHNIDAAQLADALVKVLVDEGNRFKKKSTEVSEACKRGGGVRTVAETILKAAKANRK